jgi:hypothetical protein
MCNLYSLTRGQQAIRDLAPLPKTASGQSVKSKPKSRLTLALYSSSDAAPELTISSSVLLALHFMTSRFGSTDTFCDWSEIKGKTGVVTFGIAHIELFDGDFILQSAEGLRRYSRPAGAVMSGAFIEGVAARPRYFWELVGDNSEPENPDVPQWLVGWWTVYDTNYYYYYFFADGTVIYIEQPPNLAWVPPKAVHNRGVCVKDESVHGFKVTWSPIAGETIKTEERFTPLGWTSQTEMNATSNKYGPLFARKMEIFKKS